MDTGSTDYWSPVLGHHCAQEVTEVHIKGCQFVVTHRLDLFDINELALLRHQRRPYPSLLGLQEE